MRGGSFWIFVGSVASSIAAVSPGWSQTTAQQAPEDAPYAEHQQAQAPSEKPAQTPPASAANASIEQVVVTATKAAHGITVQSAPLSVSALGADQIAAKHLTSISELSTEVPNVYLPSNTSFPGFSNFSIRGMAIYSTNPSYAPTVGVFMDGVYEGSLMGAGWNTFDLSSIEVLRGPQGIFFGRNVTAGAVLVHTTDPQDTFGLTAQAGVESGPDYTASVVATGPLDDVFSAKIAAYWNKDQGLFRDDTLNRDIGASQTVMLRGALTFHPNDKLSSTVKIEYGDLTGDGVVNQDHLVVPNGSFDTVQDTPGFIDGLWWQASDETTLDVGFGNGRIFNLIAWRKVDTGSLADVDATPLVLDNNFNSTLQEQFSDELRYAGTFWRFDVSTGVFGYFDSLDYIDDRVLQQGAHLIRGGGRQKSQTWAEFANVDFHLTDTLTLSLGERYSVEYKQAKIQPLVDTSISPCSVAARKCQSFAFPNNENQWPAFTPRIGIQWQPDTDTNLYGFYTKGFRSGGFNLQNSNGILAPAYNQEVERTFEVGLKKTLFDNNLVVNLSAFQNQYTGLQRDHLINDPNLGVVHFISNSANVRIRGVEAEVTADAGNGLTLSGNFGFLESKFTHLESDLSGNGSIGPEDYLLRLPFLSPWSYGLSANYVREMDEGILSTRLAFNFRSLAYSNDANTGRLPAVNTLDANIGFEPDGKPIEISLYGKNLLNAVDYTYNNPLSFSSSPGGPNVASTFSSIAKGRVIGGQVKYHLE